MEGDNHPAKQLANYKLHNSYTFFGTIHIKTSATMLTVFYILLLAVVDFTVDIVTTTDSSSVTYGTIASTTVLFAILLAQYGIWKESSLCLLPLIVIQVLLGVMVVLTLAFASFLEFHCFLIAVCPSGRFLMLTMGSAIFSATHCYCIIIMWLCWKYFRYLGKKAELEQTWPAETTDDLTDENILLNNIPLNLHDTHVRLSQSLTKREIQHYERSGKDPLRIELKDVNSLYYVKWLSLTNASN